MDCGVGKRIVQPGMEKWILDIGKFGPPNYKFSHTFKYNKITKYVL